MESSDRLPRSIFSLAVELQTKSLAPASIHRVLQVCSNFNIQKTNLWNERWNQYTEIPALSAFVGRFQNIPNDFQRVKALYQAVIEVIEQAYTNSESILKASKAKYLQDAFNPYRLQELILNNEDRKLIEFYESIRLRIELMNGRNKILTPGDLERDNFTSDSEFAKAIRAWFKDDIQSSPCLDQVISLVSGAIPPEIKYLTKLGDLALISALRHPYCFPSLPRELAQLKHLSNVIVPKSVRLGEVPHELLELPYKEGWNFDPRRAGAQDRTYSFFHYVSEKNLFLFKLIADLDTPFFRREIIPITQREDEEYRNLIDSIRIMEQWLQQNKTKLSNVTKLEFYWSYAYFPNIQEFENLKNLDVGGATCFYPEITELSNLENLSIAAHKGAKKFSKYRLPDLRNLKKLKSLTIPLLTIPREFLALTNLEVLHISPDDFELPCDEVLDSSIRGIQRCLLGHSSFKNYLDLYKEILAGIDGEQPIIDDLKNRYLFRPGKLFLLLRGRINSYKKLLMPIFESASSLRLPPFVSEELKKFRNGAYDNSPYQTIERDPFENQKGNTAKFPSLHALVLRDWIQQKTTLSSIKAAVVSFFCTFALGTSLTSLTFSTYSFTAKIIVGSIITIAITTLTVALFIKIARKPIFLLNYGRRRIAFDLNNYL